jgi:hypothetical protein
MRIARGISIANASKPLSTAAAFDADALAYFTANTAITSTSDKNAINTFYLGLKSDGIYTKIKAMYLPLWGSAATCKWNMKDPRDLDVAYRLNFTTGWTYSSSGLSPLNASAQTYFNPNTNGSLDSNHISYYSRTNSNGTEIEIGSNNSGGNPISFLEIRTAGTTYGGINQSGFISASDSNSQGFYIASRTSSSAVKIIKNGSVFANAGTLTSTSKTPSNISIGALFTGGGYLYYTTKQCAFSSIGDGLTDAESANFSNRVNTLLTYFGINIY